MQQPWWRTALKFACEARVHSTCLVLLVLTAICGSALVAIASYAVTSKFVRHVLIFLEYAVVVGDAVLILMQLAGHLWKGFKGLRQ